VTAINDITILADNLIYLLQLMNEHYDLCQRANVACQAPLTQIEVGQIFFEKIDWNTNRLGGLNAKLFDIRNNGINVMALVAKQWCTANLEHLNNEVLVSPSVQSPTSASMPDQTPISTSSSSILIKPNSTSDYSMVAPKFCFHWDGQYCSSRNQPCRFAHPKGQDTRNREFIREQQPSFRNYASTSYAPRQYVRSRSRDRSPDRASRRRFSDSSSSYSNFPSNQQTFYRNNGDEFRRQNRSYSRDRNDSQERIRGRDSPAPRARFDV